MRRSFLALLLFCGTAAAQTFPAKPVKLIVTYPPGGSSDLMSRVYGAKLAELWGQQVIIESKPGAAGSIGSELCRQLCAFRPARIVLVEQAENALFNIHRQLLTLHPEVELVPSIADVCDRARMEGILRREEPVAHVLSVEEGRLVQKQLELELKLARMAALSGEAQAFQASLATASDLLARDFDASAAAVEGARVLLEQMRALDIAPAKPDISRSLTLLRAIPAGGG